jgi:hypothetical protein
MMKERARHVGARRGMPCATSVHTVRQPPFSRCLESRLVQKAGLGHNYLGFLESIPISLEDRRPRLVSAGLCWHVFQDAIRHGEDSRCRRMHVTPIRAGYRQSGRIVIRRLSATNSSRNSTMPSKRLDRSAHPNRPGEAAQSGVSELNAPPETLTPPSTAFSTRESDANDRRSSARFSRSRQRWRRHD